MDRWGFVGRGGGPGLRGTGSYRALTITSASANGDVAAAQAHREAGADVADLNGILNGILNCCQTKVPMGIVEAVNDNIKALLRRGRGYSDLNYLLKAQRLAVTKTQLPS